jgi:hypothetical protein
LTDKPKRWLPPAAYRKFQRGRRNRVRGDQMMTDFVKREVAAHKTPTETKST